MSRCSICDYTTGETYSEFHDSVTHQSHGSKRIIPDRMTNEFYCAECFESIRRTYLDMLEEEDPSEYDSWEDVFQSNFGDIVSRLKKGDL